MASEAFLINPLFANRKRRKNPLFANRKRRRSGALKLRALKNRKRKNLFGNRARSRRIGMSRNLHGLSNRPFRRARRSGVSRLVGALRNSARRSFRRNPLGEEVIIVGANPRRRRRNSIMATNRKRKRNRVRRKNRVRRRRNPILMNRPRRRRRRNAVLTNPRRRRRNAVLANRPRRRRRNAVLANRRRRRNPAGIGAIVSQTTSLLPLVATGTVSGIATYTIPRLLKTTGYVTYGVQAAVIMGGGWLIDKQFGREHSKAWIIGGASALLATMLQSVVSKTLALAGVDLGREEYAAFPQEYAAFPQEYEGMEGVGREEYADAYFGQEDEEEIAY